MSWLPAAVWCHGAQSTITGGSSRKYANWLAIIAWFEHHMRWVLITAFGMPVEPEVNRNLTMVSGPTCGSGPGSSSGTESITSMPSQAAVIAFAKFFLLAAKISPGVNNPMIARSLAKSVESSEYAGDTGA